MIPQEMACGRKGGISILMSNTSRFTRIIRIDPNQLAYLKDLHKYKTLAGTLDFIINFYKLQNDGNEKLHKVSRK